jgi:hypothetical protein
VVGISRSSSGDIKAKWWGYQGQGEGLRGQGKKKWWGVRALSNSLYWLNLPPKFDIELLSLFSKHKIIIMYKRF